MSWYEPEEDVKILKEAGNLAVFMSKALAASGVERREDCIYSDQISGFDFDYAISLDAEEVQQAADSLMQQVQARIVKNQKDDGGLTYNDDGSITFEGQTATYGPRSPEALLKGSFRKLRNQPDDDEKLKWKIAERREDLNFTALSIYDMIEKGQAKGVKPLRQFRIGSIKAHEVGHKQYK